jgi:uncharacterized heparinase superfamily protein
MMGTLLRTVSRMHPLQIAARAPHALVARAVRDVPAAMAPALRAQWKPAPAAMRALANAERARSAERLARLPASSRLHAYEACYGLELGADEAIQPADWSSRTAVEPYPASVRARRLAVAARCGRARLDRELARAARAVLLQPEVHLLGNHLLENGFALASAGAAAVGPEADAWWRAGVGLLAWQLPAQLLADGGHVERSASYHAALTAALLETIELADASERGAPEAWRLAARRALGWLLALRAPDGTYPLFNDAALDAAPLPDLVLALGRDLGLDPAPSDLAATGWVRLETSDAYLVVDAGPDAGGWQPGHAHADGLTFELWVGRERAIVDFGVASYEWGVGRTETRATRSHNTVEVDGRDSCEVWGAFRMGRRGKGRVLATERTREHARAELDHDGYTWLPGAPRHRRTMVMAPGQLTVHDRVEGRPDGWVSRLRVEGATRLKVGGDGEMTRRDDRWHPRHGDPRPALLFELRPRAGEGVDWRIEW